MGNTFWWVLSISLSGNYYWVYLEYLVTQRSSLAADTHFSCGFDIDHGNVCCWTYQQMGKVAEMLKGCVSFGQVTGFFSDSCSQRCCDTVRPRWEREVKGHYQSQGSRSRQSHIDWLTTVPAAACCTLLCGHMAQGEWSAPVLVAMRLGGWTRAQCSLWALGFSSHKKDQVISAHTLVPLPSRTT